MVNGGGAVVIEFRREPFATYQKAVRVPWNEIVLIDPIELVLESSSSSDVIPVNPDTGSSCITHNYRHMVPRMVTAPRSTSRKSHLNKGEFELPVIKPGVQNQAASRAVILRESALVQHSVPLPGGSFLNPTVTSSSQTSNDNQNVSLVYISSHANEFMSTISLQLVPTSSSQFKIPDELRLIHLKIVIEGNLFEQTFEPSPNLTFTYGWNRRNVYRQKCYGLSNAIVSVGYEYFDCKQVIWSTKHIQLPGYDLSISDIGLQWNLNIHHRFNYRDSILQRGDGENFYLKTDKPKIVVPVIGDGYQRPTTCPFCDGATTLPEQRLLKPQAIVSAPDGSIYLGDYNLIRRIEPNPSSLGAGSSNQERLVRTILEIPPNQVPSRYSLAMNLADSSKLYMSDFDRHQIYYVREQADSSKQKLTKSEDSSNQTSTAQLWEDQLVSVVGSGNKCHPEDGTNCGDGQLARTASLIDPKSIAFDLSGRMYIADGHNIRVVEKDQKIYTLLGSYDHQLRHNKFPCSRDPIPMHKFAPKWPQDIAISPIDDSLHILDDNVVYKVTQDKRIQIVAGKLAHCVTSETDDIKKSTFDRQRSPKATEIFLQSAQSIAFSQNGDLYISEEDQKRSIARVLVVSSIDDTIKIHVGLRIREPKSAGSNEPTIDTFNDQHMLQQEAVNEDQQKQKSSNLLTSTFASSSSSTRASNYKLNTLGAMCVDQQGRLIVADREQLRLLSIEPDLPQINSAGEYELESPYNADEILVFNRFGHQIATRELNSGTTRANKYTFTYSVNTAFGQLASIQYSSGNRISIYRDGPHHSVKMIETSFGGQCKLDISRNGQVHSITIITPNPTKTNFSYQVDGGLMRQSRDQSSGEVFDFLYDEFGRAISIQNSSPRLPSPVECRLPSSLNQQWYHSQASSSPGYQMHPRQQHNLHLISLALAQTANNRVMSPNSSPICSSLVVAE